jgi:predicted DNA-binding protein (MmcQ/YjbR family)
MCQKKSLLSFLLTSRYLRTKIQERLLGCKYEIGKYLKNQEVNVPQYYVSKSYWVIMCQGKKKHKS